MGNNEQIIHFDWAAKFILRDKSNFDIFEGLISTILNQPVHIMEFLESESNQRNDKDKFNRVDIKAKDNQGDIILVEIQFSDEWYFMERVLYGVAKTIIDHISLGEEYEHIVKVYSISLLYFDFGEGSDYLYHGQNQLVGVHTGDILKIPAKEDEKGYKMVGLEDLFPEYYLLRINQFNSDGDSPMEQWMRYLKDGVIDKDTEVPGLVQAAERLAYLKMSVKDQREYEAYRYEMAYLKNVRNAYWYKGQRSGYKRGIERGKKKALREIAEKMRSLGVDEEEINKLIQQLSSSSLSDHR